MHPICAPFILRRRSLAGLAALVFAAAAVIALAAPSASRAGWLAPTPLSGAMAPSSANAYDAVVTSSGIGIASWTLADGGHAYSRSDVAGTWSASARMPDPASGLSVRGMPVLAVTPAGVLALWAECAPGESPCSIMTSEYAMSSSTWSAPVEVADGADSSGLDLSVGPDGSAVVSWASFSQNPRIVNIATGTLTGGVWSWSIPVTYQTGMSRSMTSIIDSAGNVMVGWHDDGDDGIQYVRRVSGTWSANAASISPDHTGWGAGFAVTVRFAVDSQDEITAVWNEILTDWEHAAPTQPAYIVRAARFDPDTETWSAPVTLTSSAQEGFERLDVIADASDRVVAAWSGNDTLSRGGEGVYAATYVGSSWSAGSRISGSANAGAEAIRLLGTDAGAVAVWGVAGQTRANVLRSGAWEYPTTIAAGNYPLVLGTSTTSGGWPVGARVFTTTSKVTEVRYVSTTALQTAPSAVQPAADYASLDVSWERPSDLGQWGVTSYTATATPGGASCTTTGLRCGITGLVNGTAYSVEVAATSPSGLTTSVPASATPLARNGYVGPLADAMPGYGGSWDSAFGAQSIAYDAVSDRSLDFVYSNDGTNPGYDLRVLGRNGEPVGSVARISVPGPGAFAGMGPAVAVNPVAGGWTAFYYEGPAGFNSFGSCGESDGTETAGAVKAVHVTVDGTLGVPSTVIDGICGAGTLSALWDATNSHFLVAGAMQTASGGRKLRGRFAAADGTAIGPLRQFGSSASDPQGEVAFSPTAGKYLALTYAAEQPVGVLINADGTVVSGRGAIQYTDAVGYRASVVYDPIADQFVLVWGDADITAQRVDAATGATVGGTIAVASREWTGRPRAVANPFTGEILVYWHEWHATDDSYRIGARPLAPGGDAAWDDVLELSGSMAFAIRPSATFDVAQCAYRIAFVGQMAEGGTMNAYTRGAQPDRCDRQQLSVATGGTGAGSVTSDLGGIDCGAICTAQLARRTETAPVVTLTATPAAGSVFDGWAGACTGTGTCAVTMDQARAAEARFSPAASGGGGGGGGAAGGSSTDGAATTGGAAVGSPSASAASTSPATGLRIRGGGPRQVGDVLVSVVDLPSAGTVTQVGRVGKRAACRARLSSTRKRSVVVRCTINRGVVRSAARAVRAMPPVPIEVVTTFTPSAGGAPITVRQTIVFRDVVPRPSDVVG